MTALALDTNLLLLFVAAQTTPGVIGKRLKAFTDSDILTLRNCVEPHDRLITTPNVWTELFNIWDWGIAGDRKHELFQAAVLLVRGSIELARASRDVVDDPEFQRLGLTDCVWLAVLDQETTLLTDDVALYNVALSRGLKAVNFTHLRDFN